MKRHPTGRGRQQPPPQPQPVTHTHHEFAAVAPATPAGVAEAVAADNGSEELLAALSYLGVIFFSFVPALIIYLAKRKSVPFLRHHAAQAVNLAVTVILFDLCALIVGAMLALDTVGVSLSVVLPLVTALWLVTLWYAVRVAFATVLGEAYELPRWLRVDLLK